MGDGDGPDDGQPQAGASVVAGPAGIRPPETLERVRQESGREAGAVVADLDAKVGAVGAGGEHDHRAARGEPQRVVQQVVDRLPDTVAVDIGQHPVLCVDVAGDPGRGQPGAGGPGAAR
jgi:hypothetical protein